VGLLRVPCLRAEREDDLWSGQSLQVERFIAGESAGAGKLHHLGT
jgi:hypothetical protein